MTTTALHENIQALLYGNVSSQITKPATFLSQNVANSRVLPSRSSVSQTNENIFSSPTNPELPQWRTVVEDGVNDTQKDNNPTTTNEPYLLNTVASTVQVQSISGLSSDSPILWSIDGSELIYAAGPYVVAVTVENVTDSDNFFLRIPSESSSLLTKNLCTPLTTTPSLRSSTQRIFMDMDPFNDILSFCLSNDGQFLLTIERGTDPPICLYDYTTTKLLYRWKNTSEHGIHTVVFLNNGVSDGDEPVDSIPQQYVTKVLAFNTTNTLISIIGYDVEYKPIISVLSLESFLHKFNDNYSHTIIDSMDANPEILPCLVPDDHQKQHEQMLCDAPETVRGITFSTSDPFTFFTYSLQDTYIWNINRINSSSDLDLPHDPQVLKEQSSLLPLCCAKITCSPVVGLNMKNIEISGLITETEREKRWIQQTIQNNIAPVNVYDQYQNTRDYNMDTQFPPFFVSPTQPLLSSYPTSLRTGLPLPYLRHAVSPEIPNIENIDQNDKERIFVCTKQGTIYQICVETGLVEGAFRIQNQTNSSRNQNNNDNNNDDNNGTVVCDSLSHAFVTANSEGKVQFWPPHITECLWTIKLENNNTPAVPSPPTIVSIVLRPSGTSSINNKDSPIQVAVLVNESNSLTSSTLGKVYLLQAGQHHKMVMLSGHSTDISSTEAYNNLFEVNNRLHPTVCPWKNLVTIDNDGSMIMWNQQQETLISSISKENKYSLPCEECRYCQAKRIRNISELDTEVCPIHNGYHLAITSGNFPLRTALSVEKRIVSLTIRKYYDYGKFIPTERDRIRYRELGLGFHASERLGSSITTTQPITNLVCGTNEGDIFLFTHNQVKESALNPVILPNYYSRTTSIIHLSFVDNNHGLLSVGDDGTMILFSVDYGYKPLFIRKLAEIYQQFIKSKRYYTKSIICSLVSVSPHQKTCAVLVQEKYRKTSTDTAKDKYENDKDDNIYQYSNPLIFILRIEDLEILSYIRITSRTYTVKPDTNYTDTGVIASLCLLKEEGDILLGSQDGLVYLYGSSNYYSRQRTTTSEYQSLLSISSSALTQRLSSPVPLPSLVHLGTFSLFARDIKKKSKKLSQTKNIINDLSYPSIIGIHTFVSNPHYVGIWTSQGHRAYCSLIDLYTKDTVPGSNLIMFNDVLSFVWQLSSPIQKTILLHDTTYTDPFSTKKESLSLLRSHTKAYMAVLPEDSSVWLYVTMEL